MANVRIELAREEVTRELLGQRVTPTLVPDKRTLLDTMDDVFADFSGRVFGHGVPRHDPRPARVAEPEF